MLSHEKLRTYADALPAELARLLPFSAMAGSRPWSPKLLMRTPVRELSSEASARRTVSCIYCEACNQQSPVTVANEL